MPDSTANLEGSQGYVSYTIKAKNNIIENTVITNKSSIIFDYNPPIETNTVKNKMVSEIPVIICNCENNFLPIWCKDVDGDGLGNPNQTVEACEQPEGYVSDCNGPGNVIGIVEQSVNDLINVYPNPCVGIFEIDIDSANFSKASISIYELSGQQIIKPIALRQNRKFFNYPSLADGIYFVEVKSNDILLRKRLVVVK